MELLRTRCYSWPDRRTYGIAAGTTRVTHLFLILLPPGGGGGGGGEGVKRQRFLPSKFTPADQQTVQSSPSPTYSSETCERFTVGGSSFQERQRRESQRLLAKICGGVVVAETSHHALVDVRVPLAPALDLQAVSDIVSCSGLTRVFRTSLTRAKQTRWVYSFHRMITVENNLVFW
jgi:hypothetical protein